MIEKELFKLINKANNKNEVPVGAIITKKGKIIAKACNKRENQKNVLGHAEIIAILKASKKLKTWNLEGCILYSSLKPCDMCLEIIKNARIKNVKYILENNKKINYKLKIEKIDSSMEKEFSFVLKEFFKKIRIKQ